MFNFQIFIIMKKENFADILLDNSTASHRVYYAPAASTSGDKVKIYRYAFERMNQEYRINMLNTLNPTKRALAKYEWAEFILEHIPHYSADRSDFFNGAKTMIINAFYELQHERYNPKYELSKAIKELEDFNRHQTENACTKNPDRPRLSPKAIKSIQANLTHKINTLRRQYAEAVRLCPDRKYEHIKQRAEYFDSIW